MATSKRTLSFDVTVKVEEREGYYVASTVPFALTVYGKSEDEAEKRALSAVKLLMSKYKKTHKDMSRYLNRRNVKHVISDEKTPERHWPVVRNCTQELRLEVPVAA